MGRYKTHRLPELTKKANLLHTTNYRCAHCGKPLTKYTATIEHIFPRSWGGDNTMNNLTVLCRQCNVLKSDKIVGIQFYKYIKKPNVYSYTSYFRKRGYDKIYRKLRSEGSSYVLMEIYD